MTAFGKYQVVEQIGEGGFGKIYKGWDPSLKRTVAIKTCSFPHPELRQRFIREAEIAANLRHPHIVIVYDFGEQDGEPYLVQEFLTGEDLDQKIKRGETIALAVKIDWLEQIAEGLGFAHANGVVHRDVKPANIRIQEDGQVRIMDFGIAKLMHADQQLTQAGLSMGTVGYLSPEQLSGEEIDHRADIFSFGVLAYELLTFRKPFEGESITTIFYRIAHEEPPPLGDLAPDTPPPLVACIERCLRKSREERYTSFADVIADLERARTPAGGTTASDAAAGTEGSATSLFGAGPAAGGGSGVTRGSATAAGGGRNGEGPGQPDGSGSRLRSPSFWLLVTGGVAVVVLAVLNVSRFVSSAPPPPPIPIDSVARQPDSLSSGSGGTGGDTLAVNDTDPNAPQRNVGEGGGNGGGAGGRTSPRGDAGGEGGGTGGNGRTGPRTAPTLSTTRVLVLLDGGPEAVLQAAESELLKALSAGGMEALDATAIGAGGGGSVNAAGTAAGAATVLVGQLVSDAAPSVGGFYTGTATLTVKLYDTASGRLLATDHYAVGSGGVPGKLGSTETAAATDAATQVSRQAATPLLELLRKR